MDLDKIYNTMLSEQIEGPVNSDLEQDINATIEEFGSIDPADIVELASLHNVSTEEVVAMLPGGRSQGPGEEAFDSKNRHFGLDREESDTYADLINRNNQPEEETASPVDAYQRAMHATEDAEESSEDPDAAEKEYIESGKIYQNRAGYQNAQKEAHAQHEQSDQHSEEDSEESVTATVQRFLDEYPGEYGVEDDIDWAIQQLHTFRESGLSDLIEKESTAKHLIAHLLLHETSTKNLYAYIEALESIDRQRQGM